MCSTCVQCVQYVRAVCAVRTCNVCSTHVVCLQCACMRVCNPFADPVQVARHVHAVMMYWRVNRVCAMFCSFALHYDMIISMFTSIF